MAISNRRLFRHYPSKKPTSKPAAFLSALDNATSAPRKKATATTSRRPKSLPYKIPRALKKAIKKNLVKIVKERRHKIKAEEHKKTLIDIEARTFESRGYFQAFDHILQNFDMSDELAYALDELLLRCVANTQAGVGRQEAGLIGKKAFASKVLEGGYITEEIKKEMLEWKGEDGVEGEEWVKIKDLLELAGHDEIDEENESGSGTTQD
ncbi:hypothetical protein M438DRAFT_350387 [Aureobasidium pullulans EXF-150]|uniref:Uncharacterized protein n=1 Tax=Aureobasidium pullulans EXF-150 TaxID=1043002 RepID=A0A074X420_AURPU|nr:uncharacterized protein M438DRAFT_350387 [Aureobasidium pullulans EXF-150]KEQ78514.1 hypothetical protein M438DRAFT_350387 [Aureobasidium pullulans EXF-150]